MAGFLDRAVRDQKELEHMKPPKFLLDRYKGEAKVSVVKCSVVIIIVTIIITINDTHIIIITATTIIIIIVIIIILNFTR